MKHVFISLIILLLFLAPFLNLSLKSVKGVGGGGGEDVSNNWNDLFKWYTSGYSKIAVGQNIFSYKEMHGSWTLPLLILGILFLVIRRKNQDLLLLSWLVALYLILHFDLFLGWGASRLLRSVNDVPYIFYTITALGVMGLLSLIKIPYKSKKYLSYLLIIIFVLFFFNFNLKSSYRILNDAYPFPYRINPSQYDAALWMKENLPENGIVNNIGTLVQKTKRYIRSISHMYMLEHENDLNQKRDWVKDPSLEMSYFFVDYSELAMFGMQKEADTLQQWENTNLGNFSPIYNKNNIRIYDVRNT
jgi:hypothetical protein